MELKKDKCPFCGLWMFKQNIKRHVKFTCRMATSLPR